MDIIEAEITDSTEKDEIMHFIRRSERGLMRGFRSVTTNKTDLKEANKSYASTVE